MPPVDRQREIGQRNIPQGESVNEFSAWERSFRKEINYLRHDSKGFLPRNKHENETVNAARDRLRRATSDAYAYCDSVSNAAGAPRVSIENPEHFRTQCRSAELSLGIAKRALEELKKLSED